MGKQAQYGSKSTTNKVFESASKVRGKDPSLYRRDPYGNVIYKHSHGKSTKMGWDVDHIKPKSKGGSNSLVNLQALNASKNRSIGNAICKRTRHKKR